MPIPLGILAIAGAGGGGIAAYDLLTSTFIESNTSSITFSGLSTYSGTYKHLQIRYALRTGASGTSPTALLRFNSSSTGYARHRLTADGASISSNTDGTSQSQMSLGFIAGASTGGTYAGGIVDILDPFSTVKKKTVLTFSGVAATNGAVGFHSGLWDSYAAVTSIDLITPTPGEFLAVAGSRVSLYGIRTA